MTRSGRHRLRVLLGIAATVVLALSSVPDAAARPCGLCTAHRVDEPAPAIEVGRGVR